jgi:hypothetical protein
LLLVRSAPVIANQRSNFERFNNPEVTKDLDDFAKPGQAQKLKFFKEFRS